MTLQPGQYYLVGESTGASGTGVNTLPAPDASGTIAMSATAGKVALVNSTTALTGGCPFGATVVDFVGYGSAASCSETAPAPAPSTTTADVRTASCTDGDNNSTDFVATAPNPRNTSTPASPCGNSTPTPTPTPATPPSGTGAASPGVVQVGNSSLLTVTVTPGANPTSSGITVTADLSAIGGPVSQQFFDDGTHGDAAAGDKVFSFNAAVAANTPAGTKTLPAQISDAQSRSASTSISLIVQDVPPAAGSVVISQVYGGGGNSGATLKNDFIEIFNHSNAPVNLTGWSVQYASSAGTTWQVTLLTGFTLQPGQYYLVQEAAGSGGTVSLPAPDATGTIAMSQQNAKVALVTNQTALSGGCPLGAPVMDFVGYGAAATCSETTPTADLSATTAALRAADGCVDTDNNSTDFSITSPAPRNSASAPNACGSKIFGSGSANPNTVQAGNDTTLTVNVTPATDPPSTNITVTADLSAIGGSPAQAFDASGNTFTFLATVAGNTTPGGKSLPVSISDAEGHTGSTTIGLSVQQPPPPADHVVISQIYGGGGNSGATYANDFVELYNPGSVPFDLTGWTIQYASFNGSGWGSNKQPIGGTIGPHQYYLISLASGGANGAPLPPANITGQINMSATTGKVALVDNGTSLTGTCPNGNPHIMDFVGYGSSASTTGFCFEGTAGAAAGSNTSSVLRRNDGATDTNSNVNDFTTGAPNPRRTAPIVELGPLVVSTDPDDGGFNAPHDASMTVNFSEPVDVDAGWYNISCASGQHNDATVAHSSDTRSYVITPNVNFNFGEQCTVTIFQNRVHDQDADDSGPNTDTLPADYTWSFTVVGAGQPAPYQPSVHLTMGNPGCGSQEGCATADVSHPSNYLMEKPTYALSYNRDKGTPNWVSWHLTSEWYGSLARVDTFRPDPAVPADWYRVQATDYFTTGFDRGHMTPNADRDNENRIPINQETYLMSNMVPQAPDNNQGPWANLENYLRTLTAAGSELYIVSGPAGVGGTGSNGGVTTTIAGGHVTVPAYTWKVVLVLQKQDGDDVARVNAATRTIAVIMPNTQGIRTNDPNDWQTYLTTVDAVEQLTGYDFFSNVPDAIENSIEAGTNGNNPPGSAGGSATTDEDTPVSITLDVASPNNSPLTTTIVNQPTNGSVSCDGANCTYTPAHNFHGADSFTFKVSDGSADSNTSTETLTVNSVNDPPVALDDSATTDEDTPATFSVLANDTDVDGDALSVSAVTQGAHGSVTLNGDGTVTYAPAANYNGPDSFGYTISDGQGGTATANVNVQVNPVNDKPVLAHIGDQLVLLGGRLTFTASATDVDAPAQHIIYSLTGSVPAGASINPTTGQFTWTPAPAQAGQVYTFTVLATDDGPGSLFADETIHVSVGYTWTGFLPPVNADGSSVFKLGRTVPVKFALTGASAGVTDAGARLSVAKITDSVLGSEQQAESTSAATTGNLFRYSDGQYIFNLSTDGLTAGTYQLRVDTGDGVMRAVNISLR